MKRLLSALLVFALLVSVVGCGNVFIRGALNTSSISGIVSIVQLTTTVDNGSSITVTLVTFLQNGTSAGITFCGDQRSQFPLNQFVNASFVPGTVCASIVQIVIVI